MTDYIIHYQRDGGQRLSENAGATATTATITGLIVGATYSITMVATSSTLPSTETAAQIVTIGIQWHTPWPDIRHVDHTTHKDCIEIKVVRQRFMYVPTCIAYLQYISPIE